MRSPNTPLTHTSTGSPGSTRLTKAASMPAMPVPGAQNVQALPVPMTVRSNSAVSSMSRTYSGSR
jgi:hypothetical protein